MNSFIKKILSIIFLAFLSCCAYSDDYQVKDKPDYEYLIGKKFEDAIFMGRKAGYKSLREIGEIKELVNIRSDGCILVFGVRKVDDIIKYWRIDSKDNLCLVRKKALNR